MRNITVFIIIFLITLSTQAQEIRKIKITDLEKTMAESSKPLIITFWATFCKPCIEEIPYFQEEVRKRGKDSIQLLLVSLDLEDYYPKKIQAFAGKQKFSAPIAWLDEYNADYFCPKIDPKWSGAIPATVFINNKTGHRAFFEEQLPREKFRNQLQLMLAPK